MERYLGVEEARAKLGQLVQEVAGGAEPVVFAKRGQALAVLISRDEYARLRKVASQASRDELRRRLTEARRRVKRAGLDPSVIDEAIEAAASNT